MTTRTVFRRHRVQLTPELGYWLACVVLLVSAIVLEVAGRAWIDAKRQALQATRQAAAAREERLRRTPRVTPERSLAAALPTAATLDDRVAHVVDIAAHRQVAVADIDFRPVPLGVDGLTELRLSMHLRGPYSALRGFLEDALAADGSLAIDSLGLHRSSKEEHALDADVVLGLGVRGPLGGAASAR